MINILQTEFFRLKKSALFWSLFGVCAVLPLMSALLNLISFTLLDALESTGMEYDVWELIKSSNVTGMALSEVPGLSDHSIFALICTSIFLCKEFSGGTFRNMLLANRSRRELYLSYILTAVVIASTYLGVSFVSILICNGAIFGFGTMTAAQAIAACVIALAMGLIFAIFLQSMMCMFMFGTRKLSVALACPLVISIVAPSLLYSFIEVFAQFGVITRVDMSWIPLYNINLLDLTQIDGALIGKILLYIIPLTFLFGLCGWITFKKADLK